MKRHATNAFYGVLDYASYPLGMLAVAPVVLHRLGAAEYGLWMVTTSIVSAGGIIASGFSDAAIQRVAKLRGTNEITRIMHAVRTLFATNLVLACVLAFAVWISAPYAGAHLAASRLTNIHECVACLRFTSFIILMRGIESVSSHTQRAFEDYRRTVQVSTLVRILTLVSAALLALVGHRTEAILAATAVLCACGTLTQFWLLRGFLGSSFPWPRFFAGEARMLFGSGVFVWLQAIGSVVFRQLDRIVLGVAVGVRAVAPYSLSIQIAEPLFGLTASGLSFFFPYLAGRSAALSGASLQRLVLKAFVGNLLLVSAGAGGLLLLGNRFLQLWIGPGIAHSAVSVMPMIVIGSALSGLSITGTYAMQALGLFRTVACISIATRALLLPFMLVMLHARGLQGLAITRVFYGAASLLVYVPLLWTLAGRARVKHPDSSSALTAVFREGATL